MTVYQMLSRFLTEMDEDYLPPAWKDAIVESVRTLRQERASEVFLDILGQLIAGGQAVIDDDMKNPREYPPGVTVVGYKRMRDLSICCQRLPIGKSTGCSRCASP